MKKFVVETKTFFKEDIKEQLLELAAELFEIFKKQKGLISVQMHLNHTENQTMTLLEWETKKDHEACMQSPDFDEWNNTWQYFIEDKKISWEL